MLLPLQKKVTDNDDDDIGDDDDDDGDDDDEEGDKEDDTDDDDDDTDDDDDEYSDRDDCNDNHHFSRYSIPQHRYHHDSRLGVCS